MSYNIGIDIGSTTVKIVITDGERNILFKSYDRHMSQVRMKTLEILKRAETIIKGNPVKVTVTGSAGQGVAQTADLPFMQEVFVTGEMVRKFYPETDCVIELGGEDAKILFLTGGLEERMNGSCAGGTGAFIDQMASLLNVTTARLDEMSLNADHIYMIASRCGVFAKSDIQPLLNQGASKENIAASIFQAVVDQTITGLAQGRQIKGNILFLGGPLYFYNGLRKRFVETLNLSESQANFPELAPYAVAFGASLCADISAAVYRYEQLIAKLNESVGTIEKTTHISPLFSSQNEYEEFKRRHEKAHLNTASIENYSGNACLGIDCGSTTTKMTLINDDKEILYTYYSSNKGNPVTVVHEQLQKIYELCGTRIKIKACAVTGYGEDLIKNAFNIDYGIVETAAHFKAAKHFEPDVSFIIDIGGQDIKCFRIRNDSIDSIILNEACSSGCGSFIETFAKSMNYSVEDFCKLGLFAENPVDLGSRCTVFMNSSVKQAQKDGAVIGDISAGLSVSVVKNALYKVIRIHSPSELGEHIVVQGGTFLNDVILRSFEKEIGRNVTRPAISGLMGAFGAALYASENPKEYSGLITLNDLPDFKHKSTTANCKLCSNKCCFTVNTFSNGNRFISGNKCERPLGFKENKNIPNLYEYKLNLIKSISESVTDISKTRTIGIPLGLNMYELLPFWTTVWSSLGFNVIVSDVSSHELYRLGQYSIPSDTVCYPAKLMHGHIENLIKKGVKDIFYPCMTYNLKEDGSTNHYNCPVVAYYPELLQSNMEKLSRIKFTMPYCDISNKKLFKKSFMKFLGKEYGIDDNKYIQNAVNNAYKKQDEFFDKIIGEGKKMLAFASDNNLRVAVLCGRPYHIDTEINHGIDKMINSFGLVIITEEVAAVLTEKNKNIKVLNQWTYHSRLYNAAKFVTEHDNCDFIQLVSFGCGIDAITTDEIRDILEDAGKLYTQIKIDEINNLGAAKIRIRSMLAV